MASLLSGKAWAALGSALRWPPVTAEALREAESIVQLHALVEQRSLEGFNGQVVRAKFLQHLARTVDCTAFLETGTYHGATSMLAAELFDVPVYTVELNRLHRWVAKARVRLAGVTGVRFFSGDSRDALRRWLSEPAIGERPMLFLDAHWNLDHPLREELELAVGHGHCVVVIDDCRVEGDSGFGYDSDAAFTVELSAIRDELPTDRIIALQPAYSSADETGGRRGTLILLVDLPLQLGKGFAASLFRRVSLIR